MTIFPGKKGAFHFKAPVVTHISQVCSLGRSDCRFGAQNCRSFVSGDNASTISEFASSHVVLWVQFTANEIAHFIVLFTPLK